MAVNRPSAGRRTWWVLGVVLTVVVASYVLVSILGYSTLATSITQWISLTLTLCLLAWFVVVAVTRKRRAARAAARASGAELNALFLGRPPATATEQTAKPYAAYPPEDADQRSSSTTDRRD